MRFLSVDPLAADYAAWSGYHYVLGNPMRMVDSDGRKADDIIIQHRVDGKIQQVKWTNGGELYDLSNGGFYKGNDNFICEVANDLSQLYQGGDTEIQSRIDHLDDRSNKHFIQSSGGQGASNIPYANGPSGTGRTNADNGISTGSVTYYSPFDCTQNGTIPCKPPEVTLTHELLGHGYDNQTSQNTEALHNETSYGIEATEVKAVQIENRANKILGQPARTTYGGKDIPKEDQQLKTKD
jgi:hypothetical protein